MARTALMQEESAHGSHGRSRLATTGRKTLTRTLPKLDSSPLPAHGSPAAQVDLQDGWQLVVGGDCCDKGGAVGGSIRVVSTLVELKRRYPTRVTLISANETLRRCG